MSYEQIKYGRTSIKTYNVNYDENNTLVATESTYEKPVVRTQSSDDNEFSLINYISALHSATIKGAHVKGFNTPGIIEYNDDYLVVVENGYSLLKRVFDLRNIELPERTKQEIREIQDYLKKNDKNPSISKYAPLIQGIMDNKTIIPLINKEDEDSLKSFYEKAANDSHDRRFIKDRNKTTYIGNYNLVSTYIVVDCLLLNEKLLKFSNDHFFVSIAGSIGLFFGMSKLLNTIGKKASNNGADNDFKDYLELCSDIANGDKEAINSLTEEIGRVSTYNDSNNSELYLSLVRDLTVLSCYKDESLTPIKIELINLGCEYVEYRSKSSEREMLEELFMDKLKAIEAKIDLIDKELEAKDDDTMNFIATHCDLDEENHLRLVPVVSNQKEFTKQYV